MRSKPSASVLAASVAVALCGFARAALAQDGGAGLNGYVTLGSGYWARGVSQNDGFSVQAGVDFQTQRGWFTGAWAANVDYPVEISVDNQREVEADVYAGYHRRGPDWSWTLSLARYLYPSTAVDYDYNELSGTVGFHDRFFYTASYSDDFYGSSRSAFNHEVSFALPLRGDVEIGASLGRFAMSNSRVDYTHWNVGVSKVVRRVVVDLRYYDSGYHYAGWLGDPEARHYVLSLSYALRAKKSRI